MLVRLRDGGPAACVAFPDFAHGSEPFPRVRNARADLADVLAIDGNGARVRLEIPTTSRPDVSAAETYALVPRFTDFTSAPTITELEACAEKPDESLFVTLLDAAKTWCEAAPRPLAFASAAPLAATTSQEEAFQRLRARRCCVTIGRAPGVSRRRGFEVTGFRDYEVSSS